MTNIPAVDQVSSDDEMYEVYSAAIQDLFVSEDKQEAASDAKVKLVVIKNHTISYEEDESEDPVERIGRWAISGVAVDNRTIEDFQRKSRDSISFELRFAFPKQALISDQELDKFFNGNGGSWTAFYKQYPNSVGYVFLSRVGFNLERNQALLYVGVSCEGLCGEGDYVLLVKERGAWSVKHKDMLWVS